MFWTRLASGIVLIAIALITIIAGGNVLLFTLLGVSMIGLSELYNVVKIKTTVLGAAGYLAALAYYLILGFGSRDYVFISVVGGLILFMAVYVLTYPKYHADQAMAGFFGIFYVAVMLSYVYQTRILEGGAYIVWLIFLCSWGCDTCAYCVGVLFGKHKLAPKLSPKKSVEGAVGGVAGAALLGAAYALILGKHLTVFGNPVAACVVICAVGAVISQIGDLAASGIKRNHEIKDYGKLIPGHGGILDRFDSVIFTAPVIYFLAVILM